MNVETYADVQERLSVRRDDLGGLHAQMAIDEVFINGAAVLNDASLMKYLRGFPAGFLARIPSIGIDALQRLRNQVVTGETPEPSVKNPPTKRGEQATVRERDERHELETHLRAVLSQIESYGSESPFITSADHLFGLGMTVVAYPLIYSRVPKHPFALKDGRTREPRNEKERRKLRLYEYQRHGVMPWDVVPVHPAVSFFDTFNDPIKDMIISEEVEQGTLMQFGNLNLQQRNARAKGTLTRYCDAEQYGYWFNDVPLLTGKEGANEHGLAPNTTGLLWYRMARAGFGYRDKDARWESLIRGVIRDARAVILSMITDYNVQEIMKLLYLWPEKEIEVQDEIARVEAEERERGPGAEFIHGTGVRTLPTDVRQIPQWAFEIQNINTQMAEEHLGRRVLSGADTTDNASVLRTNLGLASGQVRVTKQSLDHLWSGVLNDMIYMQKHEIGQPLSIPTASGYVDFDAKKIHKDARIDVDMTPVTPEERAQKLQEAIARVGGGTMSLRRMLEDDTSVEDVDEEIIEIDSDSLMNLNREFMAEEARRRFGQAIAPSTPQGLPGDTQEIATVGSQADVQRGLNGVQPPGGY